MKIIAIDGTGQDSWDVAEMVYETDKLLAQVVFGKDRSQAIKTLSRLIESGDNFFGYEHINLVTENENIVGYYIGFRVADAQRWRVAKSYFGVMSYVQFLRYLVYGRRVINQLLISRMDQNDYYLSNLYIKAALRNRGMGSQTVQHVVREAHGLGCKKIVLEVSSENRAINLYTRLGFREVHRRQANVMQQSHTVIHMEYSV